MNFKWLTLLCASALFLSACGVGLAELGDEPMVEDETRQISDALTSTSSGALIRATEAVNLRSGPSTSYSIYRVVPAGGLATVVSATAQNGFYKLTYNGQTGYSHGAYWESLPKITSTDDVNLRTGPSTGYSVIRVIPSGSAGWRLSTGSNGFWYVYVGGDIGYSHSDWWTTTSSSGGGGGITTSLVVNGHTLNSTEDKWVRYIAKNVVPHLSGDRATRLTVAARVTWWSLKEGVLDVNNAVAYSNCHYSSGDAIVGPLTVCPSGAAWQVGVAAVQVPGISVSQAEQRATALYPGLKPVDVLYLAAVDAGYGPGTSEYNSILNSTGSLRVSWLLRNSAVGFSFEEPAITYECINNSYGWCYGTGWDTSQWYAPNRTAAMNAVNDVRNILDALAP